jgi:hypothetical protein
MLHNDSNTTAPTEVQESNVDAVTIDEIVDENVDENVDAVTIDEIHDGETGATGGTVVPRYSEPPEFAFNVLTIGSLMLCAASNNARDEFAFKIISGDLNSIPLHLVEVKDVRDHAKELLLQYLRPPRKSTSDLAIQSRTAVQPNAFSFMSEQCGVVSEWWKYTRGAVVYAWDNDEGDPVGAIPSPVMSELLPVLKLYDDVRPSSSRRNCDPVNNRIVEDEPELEQCQVRTSQRSGRTITAPARLVKHL